MFWGWKNWPWEIVDFSINIWEDISPEKVTMWEVVDFTIWSIGDILENEKMTCSYYY